MASLLGLVKSGHMHLGDLGLALLSPNGLLTYAPLVSVDYKVISDDHDSLPSTCTLESFFFFLSRVAYYYCRLFLLVLSLMSSVAYC